MKVIIALFMVISVALCQKPTPCNTPQQWEARYIEYISRNNEEKRTTISYDGIYQRKRVVEDSTVGNKKNAYDILYLYSENIKYSYDKKARKCTKQAIDKPWKDFGIPANATSLGENYIGSSAIPNGSLLTTMWQDQILDVRGNTLNYLSVWTREGCLPVNIVLSSPKDGVVRNVIFFGITLGIQNANVFMPREECLKA